MSNDTPRRRRRIAGERTAGRTQAGAQQAVQDETPAEQPRSVATATMTAPRTDSGPEQAGQETPNTTKDARDAQDLQDAQDARPSAEAPARRAVPVPALVVLAVLAVLTFVLVVVASFYGVPRLQAVREADAVAAAERTAPAAAERAAAAILSYDYTSLDTDRNSAVRYMTAKYRKQYVHTFDTLVKDNATKLKAKVDAQVKASGVAMAQPGRVNVLLYVNQTTSSTANTEPQVALNRVMFSMVEQDGSWLVDDITSY